MKLTARTSGTTVIVSPTSSAPRPPARRRPVEHRASLEVTAGLDQRDAGQDLACAAPLDDGGIVALHPRPIVRGDPDRTSAERPAPFDHHAVEVRMRHGDPGDAAHRADRSDARVIDEPETVPEEVTAWSPNEERTLTDADRGLRPDARQAGLDLAQFHSVALGGERGQRRPRLAA